MMPRIITYTGLYFDFEHLENVSLMVSIADIIHALSQMCRFTGHTNRFYSVAQHSVLASHLVPPEHAFPALMHDAHEAYMGDVSAPLKSILPDYQALEGRVQAAVLSVFGISTPLDPSVKRADLIMLATEVRDLMHPSASTWSSGEGIEPMNDRIEMLHRDEAFYLFLDRFDELYREWRAR